MAMTLQRELLHHRAYTHTLIAELDEIVTPSPQAAGRGLRDYLARNAHRRTVAPAAYELQQAWSVEPPLDWNSFPLMRQRSAMVASCSLRKPLLSRVATHTGF